MTIADIAREADVPVESVLRVLNRDDVSSDVAERVREAMHRYGYGRLPQLAAEDGASTHRAVSGEVLWNGAGDPADVLGRVRRQLVDAVGGVVGELDSPGAGAATPAAPGVRAVADRMSVMDALLHKLAQDVDEMKRELGQARSERLEDLTLLVDLITTSWRAVDRRLGRIDRKLERLEGTPGDSGRPRLP